MGFSNPRFSGFQTKVDMRSSPTIRKKPSHRVKGKGSALSQGSFWRAWLQLLVFLYASQLKTPHPKVMLKSHEILC